MIIPDDPIAKIFMYILCAPFAIFAVVFLFAIGILIYGCLNYIFFDSFSAIKKKYNTRANPIPAIDPRSKKVSLKNDNRNKLENPRVIPPPPPPPKPHNKGRW
jgi:hypothetical protein